MATEYLYCEDCEEEDCGECDHGFYLDYAEEYPTEPECPCCGGLNVVA